MARAAHDSPGSSTRWLQANVWAGLVQLLCDCMCTAHSACVLLLSGERLLPALHAMSEGIALVHTAHSCHAGAAHAGADTLWLPPCWACHAGPATLQSMPAPVASTRDTSASIVSDIKSKPAQASIGLRVCRCVLSRCPPGLLLRHRPEQLCVADLCAADQSRVRERGQHLPP